MSKKQPMMTNINAKIYLFCCATSYEQAEITQNINQSGIETQVVLIPCSGKLDILYLTKAFETGADGVAVMICKEGDCRYLEGNMRAKKRVDAVEKLLEEAGLGQGRITFIQMKDNGITQAVNELEGFIQRIKDITQHAPIVISKK
ncbi:MAG: hydrogenase iron-sulfur subunit [Dehalococcoidales bacterium]